MSAETITYNLARVHDRATEWLHLHHCPELGLHRGDSLKDCEVRFRSQAGFLVAALMPALLREVLPEAEAHGGAQERERITKAIQARIEQIEWDSADVGDWEEALLALKDALALVNPQEQP